MATIKELLKEAENLLYLDIEKELAELGDNSYPRIVNPEKYEKLRKIYEQVLEIEPANEKGLKGIQICTDMLQPYIPVQHLAGAPPDDLFPEDFITLQDNNQSNSGSEVTLMPWEIRRKILDSFIKSDNAGIKYTQQVFTESSNKADLKVKEIISHAKLKVLKENKNPYRICRETIIELAELQEQLNQAWKGHGPEIIHSASDELLKELGIEEEIKNKIDVIKDHISGPENIPEKTIGLDKVDDFISIFTYINPALPGFKKWANETLAFYSSLVLGITIYSNGSYTINAHFPSIPDKEADEVFTGIKEFNMQKLINMENFVDCIFLSWVWDTYFYEMSE